MTTQTVSIHHPSTSNGQQKKDETSFDPFNFTSGQDSNIRWLNRPNRHYLRENNVKDAEKFRITFDAENFQPQQIKIYIINRQLTITGVYEERSEGRYMQKQFEKSFDLPDQADVEAMAAFITPGHMLVVEIPLNPNVKRPSAKLDLLSVDNSANNQRRLSFSLDKFNTLNNQNSLAKADDSTSLLPPSANQQVRRTSITKTMTTTTTSGSGLPTDISDLLRTGEIPAAGNNTYVTTRTERRASNSGQHQILIKEPNDAPSTVDNHTASNATLTDAGVDLSKLGIEIPPELLTMGGTITIQKRRVSVTRTADAANASHAVTNNPQLPPLPPLTTTPPQRPAAPPANPHHQQPPPTANNARPGPTTILPNNERKAFTLDEFLQNKIWNPTILNEMNGQKILHMRLELKPGTKAEHLRITLDGYDLRVEMNNRVADQTGGYANEQSYRQVTLFPNCDVNKLTTVLKNDGCLHIRVPIQL